MSMTGAKGAVGSLNRQVSWRKWTRLYLTPALLTLNEVQLCQQFQLLGDVQLEVSEGRVGIQGEILEILDGLAEPAIGRNIQQWRSCSGRVVYLCFIPLGFFANTK